MHCNWLGASSSAFEWGNTFPIYFFIIFLPDKLDNELLDTFPAFVPAMYNDEQVSCEISGTSLAVRCIVVCIHSLCDSVGNKT